MFSITEKWLRHALSSDIHGVFIDHRCYVNIWIYYVLYLYTLRTQLVYAYIKHTHIKITHVHLNVWECVSTCERERVCV